jgi:hypothetical protein
LDAIAIAFFIEYEFPKNYGKPTMGDVLTAFRGKQGKREQTISGATWWDYRRNDGLPLTNEPQAMENIVNPNRKTSDRIRLPLATNQKPFTILPHNDFVDKETVNVSKSFAVIIGVVPTEADFFVTDEFDLSASSSSESGSPDKDKKM